MDIQTTIITSAAVLYFAIGYLINRRHQETLDKLSLVMAELDGLRQYLYEIDPQFDDERKADRAFEEDESMFAGMDEMALIRQKEAEGKRTLNTRFS